MWFSNETISAVDRVARIRYVDRVQARLWNDNRRTDELRLLTGWSWFAKSGASHRQGFKTMSAAYRDAYYALVQHIDAPGASLTTLRIVRKSA